MCLHVRQSWGDTMRVRFSRNGFGLALVAASLLVLSGCGQRDIVKIGVALPLSGSMAEYGQNAREGIVLAAEELRRRPEIKRFELIFQDTKEAPQETLDVVRRLVDVHKVRFIIGGLTSSGVFAAAPYAQSHGVLFFSPAASAPGIPEIGDLVFRNWPSDKLIASQLGRMVAERLRVRTAAVLHVSNDYGKVNADAFAQSFEAGGGRVVMTRSFPQGWTDFRTLLTQVAGMRNLEKVYVAAYPDEFRALFQQLGSLGPLLKGKILASDTLFSPRLVSELGPSAEGTMVAVAAKPGLNYEPRQRFFERYRARFKTADGKPKEPGLVSDTAYDALYLVMTAISQTDGSPGAVSRWLLSLPEPFRGASGPIKFTSQGDIVGQLACYEVRDGRFTEVRF